MKILHIHCNYAGTILHRRMIGHLNQCGVTNTGYVPVYQKEPIDVTTPGAEVILSQCFRKWDRIAFDYKQSRILKDIQRKCDVSNFQCIHAYTLFTDGNTARKLSQKYNIPYVVAVRSTDVNTFFKKVFYLRKRGVQILRDASAVFFLSETYRTKVLEQYVPENLRQDIYDKSYIMPNGIDDFWLENKNTDKLDQAEESLKRLSEKKLNVIFAGLICERKNPLATQEALQLLRQKGWEIQYTVAGKIVDKRIYEKMCEFPNTVYVGQQPKEKLLTYYRANDLFVMPSHTETFGLVYSEAMSQGLPVLYTKGQGFDGQFPDGVVGYPICDTNPQEIADKVERVIKNYQELVTNCLQYTERFRWDDICGQYKKIYAMITSE